MDGSIKIDPDNEKIIVQIAKDMDLPEHKVRYIIKCLFRSVKKAVRNKESVFIPRIGTLYMKDWDRIRLLDKEHCWEERTKDQLNDRMWAKVRRELGQEE